MTPYWPIVAEPAEPSFGVRTDGPEHTVHLFVPRAEARILKVPDKAHTPTADARPAALLSRIVAFLVEGFALSAAAMYPEMFCGTEPPARPSPDELADDAPRSWRSDVDAELQAIVAMHRTRR